MKTDLYFALMCLCAIASVFSEIWVYQAIDLSTFLPAYKMQVAFQGLQWIFLAWFIAFYTGATRRWLAMTVTGAYALAVIVHIILRALPMKNSFGGCSPSLASNHAAFTNCLMIPIIKFRFFMDRISEFDQALDLPAGGLGVYSGRVRIKSDFENSVPIAQGKSDLWGIEQHKAEQCEDFYSVVNGWVLAN